MEKKRLRHQELVALLSSTIATVCRSYLSFKEQLELEGLLGVTIDTEHLVLVNIRETLRQWDKSDEPVDLTVCKNKVIPEKKSHNTRKHFQSTSGGHTQYHHGNRESHTGNQRESTDFAQLQRQLNESNETDCVSVSSVCENLMRHSLDAKIDAVAINNRMELEGDAVPMDTESPANSSHDSIKSEGSFMHELVNNILTADNMARDEPAVNLPSSSAITVATAELDSKCEIRDETNAEIVVLDVNSNSKHAPPSSESCGELSSADGCMSLSKDGDEGTSDSIGATDVELAVVNTDSQGNFTVIVSTCTNENISNNGTQLAGVPQTESIDATSIMLDNFETTSTADDNEGCESENTQDNRTNVENSRNVVKVKSEIQLPHMADQVNTWLENNVPSFENNAEKGENVEVKTGEGSLDGSQLSGDSTGCNVKTQAKSESSGSEGLPDVMEAALSAAGVSMTTYEPEIYRDPSSGKVRKQFRCPACPKIMQSMWKLRRHLSSHTGVKPFRCEICSKEFVESGLLTRHLRTHSGEKPFRCSVCCQVFTDSGNLRKHRRLHRGAAPHECYMCGETFHELNDLYSHMGSHSGLRPFECAHCGKNFTQPGHLSIHRLHCKTKP